MARPLALLKNMNSDSLYTSAGTGWLLQLSSAGSSSSLLSLERLRNYIRPSWQRGLSTLVTRMLTPIACVS